MPSIGHKMYVMPLGVPPTSHDTLITGDLIYVLDLIITNMPVSPIQAPALNLILIRPDQKDLNQATYQDT